MAQMVVRNIPDEAMERFKKKAKSQGKSAEAYARELIETNSTMSKKEALEKLAAIRKLSKPVSLETALKIQEETRQELHSRPNLPDLDSDT